MFAMFSDEAGRWLYYNSARLITECCDDGTASQSAVILPLHIRHHDYIIVVRAGSPKIGLATTRCSTTSDDSPSWRELGVVTAGSWVSVTALPPVSGRAGGIDACFEGVRDQRCDLIAVHGSHSPNIKMKSALDGGFAD